ncbi:MAG TPA: ABC transporter permease [Clostridiaceae bacterium]|jgi:simple sugar transport system permease protein|nr:ABC transporter permease [Clostridiaceae bacterium]HBG39510.1 ABC transporter permease [Clostridiaceae bacterium]HBN29585.1 ABC transporter permease [Clostridiaceae bacterium]HBX47329.1 ABC transporter permease [Clostridiaceae bacterium]HCL50381.1 ABC transporter permease [Clostridiaceae bacterium]
MSSGSIPGAIVLLTATLRLATPLMLTSLGGVFSEKSGVVNIGLEGIMTTGAFFAVYGSYISGNPWIGVLFAMLSGAIVAGIHAVLSIHLKADQVISGTAINVFAAALTNFLIFKFYGVFSQTPGVTPVPYPRDAMLKIPVIGTFLSELNWFVFLAFGLVILSTYILNKTVFGLRIRAVGEHPRAADTLGVDVYKIRYICVILSGVLGGLGGATLSIGMMNMYLNNMVSGRGFIALAAMIFGNWKPLGSMGACLIFAFADALSLYAKKFGLPLPQEFYASLPYLLTMIALAGFVGKTTAPREDGIPYTKGER